MSRILSSPVASALKSSPGGSALKCSRAGVTGGTLQITIAVGPISVQLYPWRTLTGANIAAAGYWLTWETPPDWSSTFEGTSFNFDYGDCRYWVWGGAGLSAEPDLGQAHQIRLVGPLSGTLVRYPQDAKFINESGAIVGYNDPTDPTDALGNPVELPTPTSGDYYNLAFGQELIIRVPTQPTLTSPFSALGFVFAFNKVPADFPWYPL